MIITAKSESGCLHRRGTGWLKGDPVNLPLNVVDGAWRAASALFLHLERRVGKQKTKPPFNESALECSGQTLSKSTINLNKTGEGRYFVHP